MTSRNSKNVLNVKRACHRFLHLKKKGRELYIKTPLGKLQK